MPGTKRGKKIPEQVVCQKNDIVILEITDMGAEGEGIGRLKGYTLFVKGALSGDTIRACVTKTKKWYGYARLLEVIQPSPYRVDPVCPVVRLCGGCQLQHCSYEKQLAWKEEKVCNCLNRIGGFDVRRDQGSLVRENLAEDALDKDFTASDILTSEVSAGDANCVFMEPILSMKEPFYYRNKAQFPIGVNKEGKLIAGFYAGRSHNIVENTNCIIQHPCNHEIVETIMQFMRDYHISAYDEEYHTGLVRHIITRIGVNTGDVMVCLVVNGTALPESGELVDRLLHCRLANNRGTKELCIKSICLNVNQEKTNAILGQKVKAIYGDSFIEDRIGEITYRISPLSFYQVNPEQTKKLYDTVLEFADLQGNEVVWDLYCGIGTISLFMAQRAAKVCGVEIVPQAIEDAKKNAEINHLTNTEFFVGAAEKEVPEQYEKSHGRLKADVVTLNPPRKGCDEKLLQTVVEMEPGRIVYVSCAPATLARDLRYLCDRGYELRRVRACDMFGMSFHVETCVLLSHKKADSHIEVKMDYSTLDVEQKPSKVTYKMIQSYVEEKYQFKVHTSYIAEVKRNLGLPMHDAPNAVEELKQPRRHPTQEKIEAIKDALIYFGVI